MTQQEKAEKYAEGYRCPSTNENEYCKHDVISAYNNGYTQCKQDMSKLSEWQLCPKCFGEGQVSNVGSSSSTYRTCLVCNGNRILIKPYINKQD